ncbi:hypothetical protein BYT27DRAFT_7258254 [Phlegmacium glaucopus]|nr:hypothetical protein BYT27DRAFT_7258254 [Phlegmacium glaucopus]
MPKLPGRGMKVGMKFHVELLAFPTVAFDPVLPGELSSTYNVQYHETNDCYDLPAEHVLGDHPTHPLASCTFRNFKRATEGRFDTLTDTVEGDRPRLTRTGLKVPSFAISAEAGDGVRGFSDQKAWAYNEDGGTVTGDVPRVSSARARRDKDKDEAQVKADGSVETEARRRLDSRLSVGETNDVC